MNYAGLDPIHYWIYRYTLRAVLDYLWPSRTLPHQDYLTARDFVMSPDGQALISYFGIPINNIKPVLDTVRESNQ